MQVILQAPKVVVPDHLREYTRQRVERFERFLPNLNRVEVHFDAGGDGDYQAKLVVYVPRHRTVVCTERDRTLPAALDRASDAVERVLSQLKEKIRGRGDRERATGRFRSG